MSARTKGRKRALDILYQADVLQQPVAEVLAVAEKRALQEPDRMASWLFAEKIVSGVIANSAAIDEQISATAQDWTLERMPNVDRAILRIGTWELLFNEETPAAVAVDEAIELAKQLSTEDSSRFVHGVLGRISELQQL